MRLYLTKRLLQIVPTVLMITFVVFLPSPTLELHHARSDHGAQPFANVALL
jgi:hypothetical protein